MDTEQKPLPSGFGFETTAEEVAVGADLHGKVVVITINSSLPAVMPPASAVGEAGYPFAKPFSQERALQVLPT